MIIATVKSFFTGRKQPYSPLFNLAKDEEDKTRLKSKQDSAFTAAFGQDIEIDMKASIPKKGSEAYGGV